MFVICMHTNMLVYQSDNPAPHPPPHQNPTPSTRQTLSSITKHMCFYRSTRHSVMTDPGSPKPTPPTPHPPAHPVTLPPHKQSPQTIATKQLSQTIATTIAPNNCHKNNCHKQSTQKQLSQATVTHTIEQPHCFYILFTLFFNCSGQLFGGQFPCQHRPQTIEK